MDAMLQILKRVHGDTLAQNAQQESLKRQLRETTIKLRKCMGKLYNLSSGYIETAMTAVERGSPAAKIIRRLRSRIRRTDLKENPIAEPLPVPVPVKEQ